MIDAFTLVAWRALGTPRFFYRWWARESPPYRAISLLARAARWDHRTVNTAKLDAERAVRVPGTSPGRGPIRIGRCSAPHWSRSLCSPFPRRAQRGAADDTLRRPRDRARTR